MQSDSLASNKMIMSTTPENFAIPRHSLQADALDRLRAEIIRGVWKPGVRLQERLLCSRFAISRSPLREAYRVLEAEGLLDLSHNRGAVVSSPSVADVLQSFVLVQALECVAIELACEAATDAEIEAIVALDIQERKAVQERNEELAFRLNNDLHRAIVLASRNRPVIAAHLTAHRQIVRMQNVSQVRQPESAPPAAEHEIFIAALRQRDRKRAVKGMQTHLKHVKEVLVQRLSAFAPVSATRDARSL